MPSALSFPHLLAQEEPREIEVRCGAVAASSSRPRSQRPSLAPPATAAAAPAAAEVIFFSAFPKTFALLQFILPFLSSQLTYLFWESL